MLDYRVNYNKEMKNPYFLMQKGEVMPIEKVACSFSSYQVRFASYEQLSDQNFEIDRLNAVPVGSVEFTRKFAERFGLSLPSALWYPEEFFPLFCRKVREGCLEDANSDEFVKPSQVVKAFTGCLKKDVPEGIDPQEKVWISDYVPLESEFRFYIQDFANKTQILGWSRYDGLPVVNPEPDFALVEEIAKFYHQSLGPSAYSVDIGWRPDLQKYCLIEINDAWALGYYQNTDKQSNPPTRQQYADMLVSRWRQILFCNITL